MAELSWRFLDEFNVAHLRRSATDWSAMAALQDAALRLLKEERGRFEAVLAESSRRLRVLGGDPLTNDWGSFRPLRLGREEDWSDWLAHLLESSRTGAFARELLRPFTAGRPPVTSWQGKAGREQRTSSLRRTDIRFEPGGLSFHIEVKIGDDAFKKTYETAEQLERDEQRPWVHLILLPEADLGAWLECEPPASSKIRVGVLTWREVARALRRAMESQGEPLSWRVWAWSFCGAAEQALLHHPVVSRSEPGLSVQTLMDLAGALSAISLLEEVSRDTD